MDNKEVLFEIRKIGNSLKVTAIDPDSGIEAVIVAPSSMNMASVKQQALKKLEYLTNKNSQIPKV